MQEQTRFLVTASEQYDQIDFRTTSLYNEKAPEPWVAFFIAMIFSVLAFGLWCRRTYRLRKECGDNAKLSLSVWARLMLSALMDSDEAFYTIASTAATSFYFLGALQLDYRKAFSTMLGFFALFSTGDVMRVLLAFWNHSSLSSLVHVSRVLSSKFRKRSSTELQPTNVYEDLGRGETITFMVFGTQAILISFVVKIIYDSATYSCHDGTPDCPAFGTFGSWGLYVLGIFMSCVFLLGPSTNFGQSEQNPSYWMQLLLSTKSSHAHVQWFDPIKNKQKDRVLSPKSLTLWTRFFMSFLINGVGFHILIHTLPLQIATQSSLLGVVFRAVGMMFLVDMDDTSGYTLKVVEHQEDPQPEKQNGDANDESSPTIEYAHGSSESSPSFESDHDLTSPDHIVVESPHYDDVALTNRDLKKEAERIVMEARAKLDLLLSPPCAPQLPNNFGLLTSTMIAASEVGVDVEQGD